MIYICIYQSNEISQGELCIITYIVHLYIYLYIIQKAQMRKYVDKLHFIKTEKMLEKANNDHNGISSYSC